MPRPEGSICLMTLDEKTLENDVVVISLSGEADLAAVPLFQTAVRDVIKRSVPLLVVDFTEVNFVNTPIWAVVVEYYQHAAKKDLGLALAGMTGRVEASFNIVRLGEFIRHYPDVNAALAASS